MRAALVIVVFSLILISFNALLQVNALIDISCLAEDNKTFINMNECSNRVYDGISAYISSSGYNTANVPVLSADDLPIQVSTSITFVSVVTVDQINGIVVISVFVDLYWRDAYLTWNESLTSKDIIGVIGLDHELIWTPDFVLFNAQSNSASTLNPAIAYIYPDGSIWWSRQGVISFNCNFNLKDFPYDEQYCELIYGSFTFGTNQLEYKFTSASNPPDAYNSIQPPTVIQSGFTVTQYDIAGILTSSFIQELWGYSFTYLKWTINLRRYPQYYMQSAVYPSLFITLSALFALWIDDISIRISVAVTALLAVIAVGWTVQTAIPITNSLTWLGGITGSCTIFVFLVCAQCCFVAYMSSKKGHPKTWAKLLIILSVPSKWYLFFGYFVRRGTRSENFNDSDTTVEMRNMATKSQIHLTHANNDIHGRDIGANPISTHQPEINSKTDYVAEGFEVEKRHPTTSTSIVGSKMTLKGESGLETDGESMNDEISWRRAMRSVDRIFRVVLSISFALVFLAYMNSPPSRSFGID